MPSLQLSRQFVRYLVTGVASFLLEYAIFYLLLKVWAWWYLLANTLAYLLVFGFNFLLNRLWTFQSAGDIKRQACLYAILLGFNLLMTNLVLYLLTDGAAIPAQFAKVIVMGCVVMWNFILYKKVIYR